jgi:hypothetical protein
MTMRMEWLRGDDDAPACWACFLVYPEKVAVLAILTNGLVDREMSVEAARQLWGDLYKLANSGDVRAGQCS